MKQITILGMGALGLLFGSMIQTHATDTTLQYLMDDARAEKYAGQTFFINGTPHHFAVQKASEATPADLLIVAVKYPGLASALDLMASCIDEHTVIISVLNGISSEELILERYPQAHVIYTVAQGMDAMKFGNELRYTQAGALHIGTVKEGQEQDIRRLADFFSCAQIPYFIEEDILYRMWCKFMLNVGINQVCMVYGHSYGQVLAKGESNRALYAAFREVLAVAHAEGIALTEKEVSYYVGLLEALDPAATPSMGQDRINRKPTEVDMFAGKIIALGKKHSICVPTNEFLYERAKEIEKEYL